MKLLKNAALAASMIALVLSCQALPASRVVGSRDRNEVELLANGKARIVDIYSFNDFHGTLAEDVTPPPFEGKNPGAAKLARTMELIREANPNSVLVSAGDNYQGSALSILTRGKVVSEIFKELGVVASAIGNHEFDWGKDNFGTWSQDGDFPFLAANLVEKATGNTPPWAKPYAIVEVGGHRIAFLGLMTIETYNSTKKEHLDGLEIMDAAETARRWVGKIRREEKPAAVVVLSHVPAAIDAMNSARVIPTSAKDEIWNLSLVPGIDAIVTGHSHQTVNAKANGVPVVQAYYNGRSLARLSFAFKDDGSFSLSASLVELYRNKASITESAKVRAVYDKYMKDYSKELLAKVAVVEGDLWHDNFRNVSPMGFWVCEAMRKRFGTQVAITNGGGLRKGFAAGQVTVQDFWDLMPFDNTAVTFKVSGEVLRRMIDHGIDSAGFGNGQFSGVIVEYDPSRPQGNKVVRMTLSDGTAVTDSGEYSVVTNDFIFLTGGDGYTMMPANDPSKYAETFVPIRDALIDAARKAGTIKAETPMVLVPSSN